MAAVFEKEFSVLCQAGVDEINVLPAAEAAALKAGYGALPRNTDGAVAVVRRAGTPNRLVLNRMEAAFRRVVDRTRAANLGGRRTARSTVQ